MKNDSDITNFWQLISKHTIEIPIIQRDYAQGREDVQTKKIRERFLDSLVSALESDHPQELDFIYGSIENAHMQPLDGQQRLTTLFLLYWFASFKAGRCTDEIKKTLSKFTYETRVTSRVFCQKLVNESDTLDTESGTTIAEQIKDSAWFFWSWQKDPTIKAMLTMLESIERKLIGKDLPSIWERLISDNPPLTFKFILLESIGLSDDLYTRMNARGKQLTNFEHFKACFEKYITDPDRNWDKASGQASFARKIDTEWTDLFWKYKNQKNQIDDTFMRFISGIVMSIYGQQEIADEKEKEVITERIKQLFNDPDSIEPEDFRSERDFRYLVECLNMYSQNNYDKKMPDELKLWELGKGKSSPFQFFKTAEITYAQHAIFYAHTAYLLKFKDEKEQVDSIAYYDWMRVTRNIILNSRVDESSQFIRAIQLITKLSEKCGAVYEYLASDESIGSPAFAEQVGEERLKAKIILDSPENKQAIFAAEDTNFCKGRIAFALYCIDINIADNTNIANTFDHKKLSAILNPIHDYIDNDDISLEFRRALLTIGNHDFYEYDHRNWSINTQSHTRYLIKNTEDLKSNFIKEKKYKDYLKELLNLLITKSIDTVIIDFLETEKSNQIPNWKRRLIAKPNLLKNNSEFPYRFGIKEYGNKDKEYCLLFGRLQKPRSEEYCKKVR